ncbi:MAG: tetratricopeptide repeat protein [Eubacterium sp.]|nr:tetratricopeptide repeat protein [Eubacterium sp.]
MKCPVCGNNVADNVYQCAFCGSDLSVMYYLKRVSGTYYNIGLERAQVRDLSGSVEVLRQSLRFDKENKDARNLLGLVYYEMGEITMALSEWVLSKYLTPEGNAADYYIDALQKNQVAVDATNQTIKKYNAALQSAQSGNEDLAIIQLKKVVSLNPHFIRAAQLLALLYIKEKDYAKAEKCLQRVRKIDANNTTTLRYLKEIYELTGGAELQDKPRKSKPKKDPLENVRPVGAYREEKRSLMPFMYLIIGLVVGIAVTFVLIRPTLLKSSNDTGSEIADVNEQLSVKESQLSALESEKEDLQSQIEELNKKIENADTKAQQESDNYEKLLKAISLYIAGDKLGAAAAVGDCKKKDFSLKEAQGLYTTVSTIDEKDLDDMISRAREMINTSYDDALKQLKALNKVVKDNQKILYLIGRCYHYKGNKKKAKKYYEKAIAIQAGTEEAVQADRYLTELTGGTPVTTQDDHTTENNDDNNDNNDNEGDNEGND